MSIFFRQNYSVLSQHVVQISVQTEKRGKFLLMNAVEKKVK